MNQSDTGGAEGAAGARQAGDDRLVLWFAAGRRPDATAVFGAAAERAPYVPFVPGYTSPSGSWSEVLREGLSFLLHGLAPQRPAAVASPRHAYDIAPSLAGAAEAVTLVPGSHLRSARALLPVVRAQLRIACTLAALPGLVAVGWEGAGTIMSPSYFVQVAEAWLGGGAFPGLGLTALAEGAGRALCSEGLRYFVGFEIEVAQASGGDGAGSMAASAKLALRVIHCLVEGLCELADLPETLGETGLVCAMSEDGERLRIGRQ